MSITVYTYNDKVLKNVATDKWLKKPEPAPTFDEITIGTQTWMAKNLAINDGGEGIYTYNVGTLNNVDMGTQYYYTWAAANRIADSIEGWHLPTQTEINTLITNVGSNAGTKLKSTSGWTQGNGTDNYGFTAWPVGEHYAPQDPEYGMQIGWLVSMWTANSKYSGVAYRFDISFGSEIDTTVTSDKSYALIVRLVKD